LAQFAIIVVGASSGGVSALQRLVAGLPANLPAAMLIVQHIGPSSILPELLDKAGPLHVQHAANAQLVRPGCIYVAPPDHHLLVAHGAMRLSRGPRENWARPAIDPLFRSAASTYGANAIGVILTGTLTDGTAGLQAIRAAGGIAVVQHPADAECAFMPQSALRHAGADYCVPLRDIPRLLTELSSDIMSREERAQVVP
jgi:two-component system chemotaxis response regulator CheB